MLLLFYSWPAVDEQWHLKGFVVMPLRFQHSGVWIILLWAMYMPAEGRVAIVQPADAPAFLTEPGWLLAPLQESAPVVHEYGKRAPGGSRGLPHAAEYEVFAVAFAPILGLYEQGPGSASPRETGTGPAWRWFMLGAISLLLTLLVGILLLAALVVGVAMLSRTAKSGAGLGEENASGSGWTRRPATPLRKQADDAGGAWNPPDFSRPQGPG